MDDPFCKFGQHYYDFTMNVECQSFQNYSFANAGIFVSSLLMLIVNVAMMQEKYGKSEL